ncbi:ABC transporter ATP-binding protein [Haloferax sp. AB510]|uniref:ABC transporter ATP-binding protein n=1 Tax=Haloferax sp. AB510 TaxID=2934172 RepID=UPI00209C42F6|nr:ABC transporter ATP-binding protein [Haloferax sp. AB510]MCO8266550.1 ABC transporter ATP-binding protein [Haloferax sp. AB510]
MEKLVVDGLGKQYGDTWALRDVTFSCSEGVVGLLGPNGAGKSTLMRILTTFQQPTEGSVQWNGVDVTSEPDAIRKELGYLPQEFGVYPNLTAEEFLEYLAGIRGIADAEDRISELLELVNLEDDWDRALGGFSGGMKQRIGIAQCLLADPELLVVDEPTVGLDPEERVRFRNLLSELAEDRIVVLSTHIVSDIEEAATEIALLSGGKLLLHDRPAALLDRAAGAVWEWNVSDSELPAVKRDYIVSGARRTRNGVLARIVSKESPSPGAKQVEPTLEDAYLQITNGGDRT